MPLEKSPSLENFGEILPESQPTPPSPKRSTRVLLLLIVLLLGFLFIPSLLPREWMLNLSGAGQVRGIVLNESGQPLQGEVLILGSKAHSALQPDGSFLLEKVPAGPQRLVILDAYTGIEIPITIIAGQMLDVGIIHFQTQVTPQAE